MVHLRSSSRCGFQKCTSRGFRDFLEVLDLVIFRKGAVFKFSSRGFRGSRGFQFQLCAENPSKKSVQKLHAEIHKNPCKADPCKWFLIVTLLETEKLQWENGLHA